MRYYILISDHFSYNQERKYCTLIINDAGNVHCLYTYRFENQELSKLPISLFFPIQFLRENNIALEISMEMFYTIKNCYPFYNAGATSLCIENDKFYSSTWGFIADIQNLED